MQANVQSKAVVCGIYRQEVMCVCVCVRDRERECVCVCHVCPLPVSAMERKESEKEMKRESYFRRDRIPTALLRLMTSRTTKG